MVGGFLVQGCGVVGKGRGDVRQADVQNTSAGPDGCSTTFPTWPAAYPPEREVSRAHEMKRNGCLTPRRGSPLCLNRTGSAQKSSIYAALGNFLGKNVDAVQKLFFFRD